MSTVSERIQLGVSTALPTIVVFLLLLNVLLAVDLHFSKRRFRDPDQVFSFLDDTAILFVLVAFSLLLSRASLTLAV